MIPLTIKVAVWRYPESAFFITFSYTPLVSSKMLNLPLRKMKFAAKQRRISSKIGPKPANHTRINSAYWQESAHAEQNSLDHGYVWFYDGTLVFSDEMLQTRILKIVSARL
ncbi:MAG: hypothetical protein H7245_15735 [Candidatus Saccharibacteria bacterium]|nr:hypothetical protein [Pseudorhodobacter sp.]